MFYLIYFTCCRGGENLYSMTLNTFKVHTDENGKKYVQQNIDEMDKNNNADDQGMTNKGKMYETPGKNTLNQIKSYLSNVQVHKCNFQQNSYCLTFQNKTKLRPI